MVGLCVGLLRFFKPISICKDFCVLTTCFSPAPYLKASLLWEAGSKVIAEGDVCSTSKTTYTQKTLF